jgi:purine-nucleoside phosphorylase
MQSEFHIQALPAAFRISKPRIGIVLGSGLGPFVDELKVLEAVAYGKIQGLPRSKVDGHVGRLLFTEIARHAVVVAQGRAHLYEGHDARAVSAVVRLMAELGISTLVLTNAAGSANPALVPGAWMMIRDHINLTGTSSLLGGANFHDMSEVYSTRLRALFAQSAKEEELELVEGIYAGVLGPQYETPAEVNMLRRFGADAIGMSTVLEAMQARALGMEVAGFSCICNWASGLGKTTLNHDEVLAVGRGAAQSFGRLAIRALAGI